MWGKTDGNNLNKIAGDLRSLVDKVTRITADRYSARVEFWPARERRERYNNAVIAAMQSILANKGHDETMRPDLTASLAFEFADAIEAEYERRWLESFKDREKARNSFTPVRERTDFIEQTEIKQEARLDGHNA